MSLLAATRMEEKRNELMWRSRAKVDLGVKLEKTEKEEVEERRSIAGGVNITAKLDERKRESEIFV